MKKGIKWVIAISILVLCGYLFYNYWHGEHKTSHFDRNITLKLKDSVNIEDEAYIKLMKIKDNRCKKETCEREGEIVAEFIVANDRHIKYVKLGTLANTNEDLEKLGYNIELVEVKSLDEVIVKLIKIKN